MLAINFSPFPTITTERLLLRRLSLDDTERMHFLRTDENVLRFVNRDPDADMQATKEKIEWLLRLTEENEAISWAITLKDEPGKMIGNIGYWNIQKENFRAETGYVLHPDHWKKGIMKEALNAILPYAFNTMKLHSIEANINPENIASAAVLESCGFVKEAYHRENFYHKGIFYDTVIYSRLNDVG